MCNRVDFSLWYPYLRRFHVDLAENWIERLIDTRGFHGKGLLFSLHSGRFLLRLELGELLVEGFGPAGLWVHFQRLVIEGFGQFGVAGL